jgi:hypothetical protein
MPGELNGTRSCIVKSKFDRSTGRVMEFTSPICKQTKSPQKGIVAVEDGMIRGFDRKYFYIRPAERPSAKDVFNLPNPGVCTLPCTAWPSTLLSWQERPGAAVNELVKPGHSAIRAIHRCSFIPFAAKQKVARPRTPKQQMRNIMQTMSCARKQGIPRRL